MSVTIRFFFFKFQVAISKNQILKTSAKLLLPNLPFFIQLLKFSDAVIDIEK